MEADPDAEAVRLEEADRHLASAQTIAASDPNGAYQLAYDAARKAVTAHMASAGFRVRATIGAHAVTASYASEAISKELGSRLDRMRRRRNRSEYGMAHFEVAEVDAAIETARALIAAAGDNAS
ncbi:MAG TPA: hypothetical protein VH420_00725 [Gaiellaceae bacterium]